MTGYVGLLLIRKVRMFIGRYDDIHPSVFAGNQGTLDTSRVAGLTECIGFEKLHRKSCREITLMTGYDAQETYLYNTDELNH
jgi:hypothetical protein